MASANVSFQYEGPAGTLSVNWWIVKSGTKPGALGGNSVYEVAYKQGTVNVGALGAYAVENVSLSIDASQFPDGLVGPYDCYVAVYFGTGSSAQLLGSAGFSNVYNISVPSASVAGIQASFT